jgi:1-acyl-sn-glycerol-3-phosphate acyltransferase
VSKSDVLRWPLLGWLIRNAGSIFIERERKRDALRVVHQIASALGEGETVAIFPEGTTGEGPRLEPFHANLLQAAVTAEAPVQPVVLRYHRPGEVFSRAAPYVGDQTLVGSMWRIACADQLEVELSFLPVQTPALGQNRREWAQTLKMTMQSCLNTAARS